MNVRVKDTELWEETGRIWVSNFFIKLTREMALVVLEWRRKIHIEFIRGTNLTVRGQILYQEM